MLFVSLIISPINNNHNKLNLYSDFIGASCMLLTFIFHYNFIIFFSFNYISSFIQNNCEIKVDMLSLFVQQHIIFVHFNLFHFRLKKKWLAQMEVEGTRAKLHQIILSNQLSGSIDRWMAVTSWSVLCRILIYICYHKSCDTRNWIDVIRKSWINYVLHFNYGLSSWFF